MEPIVSGRRALLNLALIAVISLAAAACGSSSSSSPTPVSNVPYSQTDLRVGTGATAVNGRRLSVNYTLWLYDASAADNKGRQVESNVGGTPFAFTLGTGAVIRGWDVGVVGMQVGGLRRLVLPPDLAYGAAGNGSIPPNATLIFEIELLSVQ